MRIACLVLVGLLAVAAPAQGLALVGAGDPDVRVQVEQGSLRAAGRGEVSLDGEPLGDELEPIEPETGPWRGLTNVTTLAPTGEGWLVLADARSGLLVPVTEEPPSQNERRTSTGNASSEDPATAGEPDRSSGNATSHPDEDDDHGPGNRSAEATTTSPTSPRVEDAGTPSTETTPTPTGTPQEPAPPAEQGEGDGLPVDPAVLVLSLLFAGAFAVERFLGTDEDDDQVEGLTGEP